MDAGLVRAGDGLSPLLPFHLQDVILERLGPKHLANTSAANHQLRYLACAERLWKSLFERRWGIHYFKLCGAVHAQYREQYGVEVNRPTLSVNPTGRSSCQDDEVHKTISEAISAATEMQSTRSEEQQSSDPSDCDIDGSTHSELSLPRIIVQPGCYDEQLAIEEPVEIVGAGRTPLDVVIRQQETDQEANGSSTLLKWKAKEGLLCHLQLMQRLNNDGRSKAISVQGIVSVDREPISVKLLKCDISSDGSGVDITAATAEVSECCIHHCGICGVSLAMAERSAIEDNFIVNNTDGILVWKSGGPGQVPSVESSAADPIDDDEGRYQPIRVCGNQMFDNTGSGIGVHSHSNAVIENNTVYNSGQSGVYFSDFALGQVQGNIIARSGMAGVSIKSGAQPLICGNAIVDGRSAGVYIRGGASGQIEDNVIMRNAKAGVGIKQHANPKIERNCISNGSAAAVCVHRTASGVIRKNMIGVHPIEPIWVGVGALAEMEQNQSFLTAGDLNQYASEMVVSALSDPSARVQVIERLTATFQHSKNASLKKVADSQGLEYSEQRHSQMCPSIEELLMASSVP